MQYYDMARNSHIHIKDLPCMPEKRADCVGPEIKLLKIFLDADSNIMDAKEAKEPVPLWQWPNHFHFGRANCSQ
ncbi:MAG: hypothetical protein LUE27_09405 [Clostridia bacterium]|nr:hypothetical protein [Clostridia bacterium]